MIRHMLRPLPLGQRRHTDLPEVLQSVQRRVFRRSAPSVIDPVAVKVLRREHDRNRCVLARERYGLSSPKARRAIVPSVRSVDTYTYV